MGPVVADTGLVRPVHSDVLALDPKNLRLRCLHGLPEDLLPDAEVATLVPREVHRDELAAGAAKIVGGVGQVAANVDLPVRISDHVDNLVPGSVHAMDATSSPAGLPGLVWRSFRS